MSVVKCETCQTLYGLLTAYEHDYDGSELHCRECQVGVDVTAMFQRNHDGQYVGRLRLNSEEEIECWLAFPHGVEDPSFLRLTFTNPYQKKN
jgi:hypothetical protein